MTQSFPREAAAELWFGRGGAHRMAELEGTITVAGLPPHHGLIVSLCFFRVEAADVQELRLPREAPAECRVHPPR